MFAGIWSARRQEEWCAETMKRLKTPPACTILGIELDHPARLPCPDDVVKAFRAKSRLYHPDRQNLNDPDAQARANEQMAELNKSREILQSIDLLHDHIVATIGCDENILDRLDPSVRREFDAAITQQQKTKIGAYYDVIHEQYVQLSSATYANVFRVGPNGMPLTRSTKVAFDSESDTEDGDGDEDSDSSTKSSISSLESIRSFKRQIKIEPSRIQSQPLSHPPQPPHPPSLGGTDLPRILDFLCTDILNLAQQHLGSSQADRLVHVQRADKIVMLNRATIATLTGMAISGNQNTVDAPFNVVYGRNNIIRSAFNYCAGENTFPYGVFLVIVGSTAATVTAKTHFSVFIDPVATKSKMLSNSGACNQYYDSIDTAIKMGAVMKYNGVFCINPHKVIFGMAKTDHDFMFRISTCRRLLPYLHDEIRKCAPRSSSSLETKKRKIHE